MLGMVAHACNSSTQRQWEDGSELGASPGYIHSEPLSQKTRKKAKEENGYEFKTSLGYTGRLNKNTTGRREVTGQEYQH